MNALWWRCLAERMDARQDDADAAIAYLAMIILLAIVAGLI